MSVLKGAKGNNNERTMIASEQACDDQKLLPQACIITHIWARANIFSWEDAPTPRKV